MRRKIHRTIVSVGLIVLPASMYAVGCGLNEGNGLDNGEQRVGVCNGADCIGAVDGGGDGGTIDPGCVPSDLDGGLADTCGVFVSSSLGSDTYPGTMMEPVATITKAIELASGAGKPVYACAEQFDEAVIVTTSAFLYGGLDCASGWAYIGDTQKTTLTTVADAIPLRLESGINVTIEDFHVLAKDATAPDTTGHAGSSIAVIADRATATFVGCTMEAGYGAAGAPGQQYMMPAQAGQNGVDGGIACSASMVPGPAGPQNMCDGMATSAGGPGGAGAINGGYPGSTGYPIATPNGGAGEPSTGGSCMPGAAGNNGADGAPGANGMGLGTIDNNGYTGVSGSDGMPGAPGQGGGGGGGAKGGSGSSKCPNVAMAGGASGGSGASGGCGGAGGRGGKPGGASIAVVSIAANVIFESSRLIVKNGGAGGLGGFGQDGGNGGNMGGAGGAVPTSATQLKAGCAGGNGGAGGKGGDGGNGVGGHSIGVAYTGTPPTLDNTIFATGTEATGGVK